MVVLLLVNKSFIMVYFLVRMLGGDMILIYLLMIGNLRLSFLVRRILRSGKVIGRGKLEDYDERLYVLV